LDPDPDRDWIWIWIGIQPEMLDLDPDTDPYQMNTDPQPCLLGEIEMKRLMFASIGKKEEAERHCLKVGPIQTATTVAHAMNIIAGMCPQREGLLSTLLEAVIMAPYSLPLHTRLYFIPEGTECGLGDTS
jgi:hypothetical protein